MRKPIDETKLWTEMIILDDFLLSLCPNPDTGKFETTPEDSHCESGISDGTPPEEQYAALFKSIGDQWEKICRIVRPAQAEQPTKEPN